VPEPHVELLGASGYFDQSKEVGAPQEQYIVLLVDIVRAG
jgi:hypothetical protein